MKLFRKLMAGAMAVAMLSAYTMTAFASPVGGGSTTSGTVSGSVVSGNSTVVSGVGSWAGKSAPVFLMKLPTSAAASQALAFTVDPDETIEGSKPTNADGSSTYGTVIFSTVSGSTTVYKDESKPMRVVSMSSVNVKVNMLATLSDTKMKIATSSGFTADKEHLQLKVEVATVSGGTVGSPETKYVDALGAKAATTLEVIPGNFKKAVASDGSVTTTVSGAAGNTVAENMTAAQALPEDSWSAVQYTVKGESNPAADWQIAGLDAPDLTIKWMIDAANEITYDVPDPTANSAYKAQLDKNAYKAGETATLYVQPTTSTQKLKGVKFKYISLKDGVGTMDRETTIAATVVETPVNGVYKATFQIPSTNMAKDGSPAGSITTYTAPSFEITVG